MMRFLKQILVVLAVGLAGSGCGGAGDDEAKTQYSLSGSVAVPDAGAGAGDLALAERTVSFTFSWSEADGAISGTYQDDYFATGPLPLSGKVEGDGSRTFLIALIDDFGGITSLELKLAPTSAEGNVGGEIKLTSFAGKDAASAVVFERKDVAVRATAGSELPPAGTPGGISRSEGDARAFFAKIKKTYDFYAANMDPATPEASADATFQHGALYKVTVSDAPAGELDAAAAAKTWGSFVIEGEGVSKTFNAGAEAADLFEKVDHEQYVALKRDGYHINLQEVFDPADVFVTLIAEDAKKATWNFSVKEPEPLVAPKTGLAKYGAEFIVGTHQMKVTAGGSCKRFEKDDDVTVTIAADGKVTATKFGTWEGSKLALNSVTTTMQWCEGGADVDPGCNAKAESFAVTTKGGVVKGAGYRNLSTDQNVFETCYMSVAP